MEIKIIASTGLAKGQAVEIRAVKFFIGRHDNCQIRPDLANLAGVHALIEQRDNGLHLRDFGGEGGTGINDRVIRLREIEVFDEDLIQIGPLVLTLSVKPKGVDTHYTLREAPDGWPFLEGAENQTITPKTVIPPTAEVAPIRREPHLIPATSAMPSRLSEFLAREAASVAVASTVIPTTAPASSPAIPHVSGPALSRPIVARSRALRAITCHQVDDVTVVTLLNSDLIEEETVSPVRYELRSLIDEEEIPQRTVLDLGNTKYLSSRAVGVLLAYYQALDRQGGAMRVCCVSKQIQPVIDQMRLSRLVDIFPTLEEAIQTPWE
jgi:anti-anti-sigma factor